MAGIKPASHTLTKAPPKRYETQPPHMQLFVGIGRRVNQGGLQAVSKPHPQLTTSCTYVLRTNHTSATMLENSARTKLAAVEKG